MRGVLLVVFFLLTIAGHAQQFPSEFWHDGTIVVEEGDTLKGSVKYDLQSDIVQYQKSGQIISLNPRKVVFFEIFDKTIKRFRQFYSLPYSTTGAYKTPVFFELLSEGKITLLCREAIEFRSYPSSIYSYYGSTNRQVLVNKYFLLKENGNIESFGGKKSELIGMMGNQGDQVEQYIKSNKLNLEKKYQIAAAVTYYNSFFK